MILLFFFYIAVIDNDIFIENYSILYEYPILKYSTCYFTKKQHVNDLFDVLTKKIVDWLLNLNVCIYLEIKTNWPPPNQKILFLSVIWT